jgi:gliding motility-associated-like protein
MIKRIFLLLTGCFFGILCHAQSDSCALEVEAIPTVTPVVRDAPNEWDRVLGTTQAEGQTVTGPSPLTVQFKSNSNASFIEWLIYDASTATGTPKRYSDRDLTHTFYDAGIHYVQLKSSNGQCTDSAYFLIQVSVSRLECPNYFTPRTTPGENDEFKVAYRSLNSFKGTIRNRWGQVLFQWTDPAQGWNGTFNGNPVSAGVYFYFIEAIGSDGIVYKKSGDINLLE